jgi:hypothetical protein
MKPLLRAAARLRDAGSIPVLAAVLVLAASAPLAAGEHSRPHDSSDQGRSAQPRSEPSRPSSPPPSSSGDSGSHGSGSGSGWGSPSSPGQEPRVAVPRSGDDQSSYQQRPRTGSRDSRHGGGGGYYGGYYGGYGGYYSPYSRYNYWGPYFGWGWWGGWWGDDYYGYYPGYNQPRYYGDRYDRYGRTTGALDIDVSPGKTEVWIDGRYVGTADDFDGFPQYLWLDRGVYDLALYREGYTTLSRQITIYAGTVISLDDRMQRGDSVKPQDLVTKTHERRDERIRSEDERREEIARRDRDGMEDWRDRARRRMEEHDRYDRGDRNDRSDRSDRDQRYKREDRDDDDEDEMEESGRDSDSDSVGRLRVEILPSDSSVYVDGKFVGTGVDLQRLREGLRLEPGEHRIAVVRPGHKSEEQEFSVSRGQEVELDIELESME